MRNSWNNQSMRLVWVVIPLVLIGIVGMQEGFSQYIVETHFFPSEWSNAVQITVHEYVNDVLIQNKTILQDSIKIRISGGFEDVLPPNYSVRILYDVIDDKIIQHIDSTYEVDFVRQIWIPENANLVKTSEMEYKPPKKIAYGYDLENEQIANIKYQMIMCRQGFEKIMKETTGDTVCVKQSTAEKLIQRGWAIDEYNTEPITLYSSKLNDDSTGSSTPGVPLPFDQEITISKIPKLGESATINVVYTIKDNDYKKQLQTQTTDHIVSVKFGMDEGFSMEKIDRTSQNFETFGNLKSYTVNKQILENSPTNYQIEITPTKTGNWLVYVDGGTPAYYKEFYFIVTEDGTILGEKPSKHASTIIPGWIKDNFGWWESGQIKDMKLDNSVQALIKFGILDVNTENIPQEVPPQFRQDIRDWHAGLMSDEDFLVILKDWVEN